MTKWILMLLQHSNEIESLGRSVSEIVDSIQAKSRRSVPNEEKEYDVKRANEILENVQEHLKESKKHLAQLEEEL